MRGELCSIECVIIVTSLTHYISSGVLLILGSGMSSVVTDMPLAPVTYNVSSVLDSRLRRETRRSRLLIKSAKLNLEDYHHQKEAVPSHQENVDMKSAPLKMASNSNPSEELSTWLDSLNTFHQRYVSPTLTALQSNVSHATEKFDPIASVDDEFYEYTGGKDREGECHGSGYLEYDDGSYLAGSWIHGVREGHFRFTTTNPRSPVLSLEGDYVRDELTGRARLQLRDETWMEGWYKDSVLHGFCRKFDRRQQLMWVGMYRNGQPFGVCWSLLTGGGSVVGYVDDMGGHTGDNIAYIYPDNHTALVGQFQEGVFVRYLHM